jgi:hypothetical protein
MAGGLEIGQRERRMLDARAVEKLHYAGTPPLLLGARATT